MSKKRVILYLAVILVLAGFFRFWQLSSVPPGLYPDEAINGNNALEALDTGNFKWFYPENNGREGLYINIVAFSLKAFGNEPWTIRLISAIFGFLTIFGLFLLAKELFGARPALFASFFLAVSFWHVMFSRIGFRAIMAPCFLVWSLYLLFKVLNQTKKISNFQFSVSNQNPNSKAQTKKNRILNIRYWILSALAGLLFGLGFHTYIAYRIMPFLLIFPFLILWKTKQKKLVAIFLTAAFLAALPLGLYYLSHPQDFLGRTSQVSIFSSESPLKTLSLNIVKTAGMFFVIGDYNWRHNLAGSPQLWWPIGILFLFGLIFGIKNLTQNSKFKTQNYNAKLKIIFFLTWIILALAPVVVSNEGIPHALRAILVIPPIMIFAGLGLETIILKTDYRFQKYINSFPQFQKKLLRIKKELILFLFLIFLAVTANCFSRYFFTWANDAHTYNAFSGRYLKIGNYLNGLSAETEKYVIVNAGGVTVKNIPMPSQTTMFITDTYSTAKQKAKKITYLLPEEIEKIKCRNSCVIFTLETDTHLREEIKQRVPGLKFSITPEMEMLYK